LIGGRVLAPLRPRLLRAIRVSKVASLRDRPDSPSGRKATSSIWLVDTRSGCAGAPAFVDPALLASVLFGSIKLPTIFASGSPCSVARRFLSVNFAVNLAR